MVTVLVDDLDAAIGFYVDALGFTLVQDMPLPNGERWIVVRPDPSASTDVQLARASAGSPAGTMTVTLFLHTDDFEGDHRRMLDAGVRFLEEPRYEEYGTVAVFEDLSGNKFDLIQPR
jgi:catechol 2,3-dioxygenase-like lactoylglutathione lyase family enzyme